MMLNSLICKLLLKTCRGAQVVLSFPALPPFGVRARKLGADQHVPRSYHDLALADCLVMQVAPRTPATIQPLVHQAAHANLLQVLDAFFSLVFKFGARIGLRLMKGHLFEPQAIYLFEECIALQCEGAHFLCRRSFQTSCALHVPTRIFT